MIKRSLYGRAGVYMIWSIVKPERYYIGSTTSFGGRWKDHRNLLRYKRHHSHKLQNHYNKYGEDDLVFVILEEFVYVSETHLEEREGSCMILLNPFFNETGFTKSGLRFLPTEESIKRQSESLKRWWGKHGDIKRQRSQMYSGEGNPFYNKKHTEETRMKIRANRGDVSFTPERKKKLSDALKRAWAEGRRNSDHMKGRKASQATRDALLRANEIPINEYDLMGNLVREWNSIKEASIALGISFPTIKKGLQNEDYSFKGRKFKYNNGHGRICNKS